MATITIEEVKEIISTSLPDFMIQAMIDQMDSADACLNSLGLTDDQIKAVKMAGVLHIIELGNRGGVSSESTKTGASRSYFESDSLNSTMYGKQLQSLAGSECVIAKVGSDSKLYMMSVNPKRRCR